MLAGFKPISPEQSQQVAEAAPIPTRTRKVEFILKDTAKVNEQVNRPTEGQLLMAKTLVDKDGNPRPLGFATYLAPEPTNQYDNRVRSFYREGATVFSAPVAKDGQPAYVGIDNRGVFLIRPGEKTPTDKFLAEIRELQEEVGDQTDKVYTDKKTPHSWTHPDVRIEDVPQAEAAGYVKTAAELSIREPFLSTATIKKESKPQPQELVVDSNPHVNLADIDF